MKMLRVKLKNLNNLRRVNTELYVALTSSEKNWSDYFWTTILLNKEYPANYKLHVLGDLQNIKINTKHFEIKQWEP